MRARALKSARRLTETTPPCKTRHRPAKGLTFQAKNASGDVDKDSGSVILRASLRGPRPITQKGRNPNSVQIMASRSL